MMFSSRYRARREITMHSINVSIRSAVIILITFSGRDGNWSEAADLIVPRVASLCSPIGRPSGAVRAWLEIWESPGRKIPGIKIPVGISRRVRQWEEIYLISRFNFVHACRYDLLIPRLVSHRRIKWSNGSAIRV